MKKEELMIGDWVFNTHNRKLEQVCEIRERMVMLDYNDLYDYDEIEPIPLNPEILMKNGFREDRPGITYRYRKFGETTIDVIDVFFHSNGKVTATINGMTNDVYCNYVHCYCGHVHELQHAMRLCRIDKEIELED